ncbi:MAG: DUF5615 family PIN-like protein [Gammaproteobacteria bacterium]
MRLLFDQNLSYRLVARLADLYPHSAHVRDFGLERGDDEPVWTHAKLNGFTLVTKDDDFRQLCFLFGPPPKVIWIRLGNCTTADVEALLRARHGDVLSFMADASAAFLLLARSA